MKHSTWVHFLLHFLSAFYVRQRHPWSNLWMWWYEPSIRTISTAESMLTVHGYTPVLWMIPERLQIKAHAVFRTPHIYFWTYLDTKNTYLVWWNDIQTFVTALEFFFKIYDLVEKTIPQLKTIGHHSLSVVKSEFLRSSSLLPGVCSRPIPLISAAPCALSSSSYWIYGSRKTGSAQSSMASMVFNPMGLGSVNNLKVETHKEYEK